jgi:hypothetical protein
MAIIAGGNNKEEKDFAKKLINEKGRQCQEKLQIPI